MKTNGSIPKIIVLIAFLSQSCLAVEPGPIASTVQFFYIVKKNDSMNKVLRSFGIRPTWGPGGAAQKLLASNPYLQGRSETTNLIFPTERLDFDSSFTDILQNRKDRGVVVIDENGQVDFNCSKKGLEQWVVLRKELEPEMDPFDSHYATLELDCQRSLGIATRTLATTSEATAVTPVASLPVAPPPVAPPPVAPAVKPANNPDAVMAVQPEAPEQKFSIFEVRFGFSYLGLNGYQTANGSNGNLISGLVPTANLSWKQLWNDDVFSHLYYNVQSIGFESDQRGNPISNANVVNSAFGLGVGEKFSERLSAVLDLELAQTLFYQGLANGSLEVDQVPLLRIHPEIEYGFIRRRHFLLSGLLGGSYYSSSTYGSYSISNGYGFDGGLKLTEETQKSEFNCQLVYGARYQNTSYLNLTEQSTGLSCGVSWGR